MEVKNNITRAAAKTVLKKALKYIDKNPEENLIKMIDTGKSLFGSMFPSETLEKIRAGVENKDNIFRNLGLSLLSDIDRGVLEHMLLTLGIECAYLGTKTVRANRDKYNCNIPFQILFDPTSACNLKCKGCWSAEYGHLQSLTLEEMLSIVSQGKELGAHIYMFTGGEPLIRKADIFTLCEKNPDCVFLAYTNGTLVDQAFCEEMNRLGNLTLALSIEGFEASNDLRRGEGTYDKVIKAMDLLKKNKCLFGLSVCYTSQNMDCVTSDEFIDLMIEKGAKYAWYFNYMPVGTKADVELIPKPYQRKHMYFWIRKMRNGNSGKPLMIVDFQDDGEFVGGCIAGGRNYFHINSAGDIEPCVFIHYSDSNIRTHTLLEALQNPLFMAYHKNQPFNDNHLRPCPMLENPEFLRKMVKETGAKSTDLIASEEVDILCGKCDEFALEWQPVADEIWNTTKHPKTHTMYARDGGKSKRQ